MQENHSDFSRSAHHALVWGSSDHVKPDPSLSNLPNLLTQPFNQTPYRILYNLNLHAWLLEPRLSKRKYSLRQWQHESRLLKEAQPDQSMR